MQRGLVITLAASTNRATERARSSRIVEKEETSLSGTTWAANGGFAPTANTTMATLNRERIVIVRSLGFTPVISKAPYRPAACGYACPSRQKLHWSPLERRRQS